LGWPSPSTFGISQNHGDTRCIPNDLFLRLGRRDHQLPNNLYSEMTFSLRVNQRVIADSLIEGSMRRTAGYLLFKAGFITQQL
jgi:hypothetical protein